MKPYLVSSDPGIDDLLALLLLAKLSFGQKHCLISSFGNAPVQLTGINAQEFISFVTPDWLYFEGASLPQNGKLEHSWPDYFHGSDGVWGVHPKTTTKHIKILHTYPNYHRLISLSPLTDANKLLRIGNLNKTVIMGGAFNIRGNETPWAETNIAFDVDAAADFFDNCKKIEVSLVPLDVTRQVAWSLNMILAIPENTPQSTWIKNMLLAWFKNYNHEKEEDFNLHDPLAVYLTFCPDQAKWIKNGVKVIRSGVKRGKTVLDKEQPTCQIALSLIDAQVIADDIFKILFF